VNIGFALLMPKALKFRKRRRRRRTNQVNPVSAAIQYDCVHINDSAMATDIPNKNERRIVWDKRFKMQDLF